MRTLKLTLAYDGTNYVGWQRQAVGTSIQALVEEALAPFAGGPPTVAAAGRTDAGVHALGQVASVTLDAPHAAVAIQRAMNVRLPPDIRVVGIVDARPGFHARFRATGKTYRYRLATTPVCSPFDRWFVWHVPQPLDLDAMRRAAGALVGRHDFSAFQAAGAAIADTTRTLDRVDVVATGGELHIEVAGDGFLRHMVRTIAGTLVDVGLGTYGAEDVPTRLASRDRRRAGKTAPAQGLTLVAVRY